ncbi:MAG: platelet-activating factor acetylhydrolase IB subunit [Verrucomicrobia bacterium]|jgi:lysophospholipase L1-like esterase|nr:platelet-activating factor acetylhydrolase IB subunit [Verrucomicrobiota bacterium]
MKRLIRSFLGVLLAGLSVTAVVAENSATNPVPGAPDWLKRHESFIKIAAAREVDLLFLGDSITDGWRTKGSKVWAQYYLPRHAANFGIAGDRTQHVLWRIENGELDGIKPKVVVLLIGTNNTGKERNSDAIRNTTSEAIQGVTVVVKELRARLPASRILLLALFPRADPNDPQRRQVVEINQAIANLDDGKNIQFLDIGAQFLNPDGTIPETLMPDKLHPSSAGYEIWAAAMEPTLKSMLE